MTQTSSPSSLGHFPAGDRWEFDESVVRVFDDMLERSIPQYRVMREAVYTLGRRFVQPKTVILDLGCSRGEAMAPFIQEFGAHNRYVGLDVSQPMLAAARERFAGLIQCGVVDIREHDLRQGVPAEPASLILAVLTIVFTPIEYRQRIVSDAYATLQPGGAFIMVEKILGSGAQLADLFIDVYHDLKAANGYTREEIERKRASLEGVQVPVTAAWNEELLRRAGFTQVDCFWRWMNFAGWIAVKA